VQAFEATLQKLAAIVRRAPAVAQPVGFAGELWGHLGGSTGPKGPLSGAVTFGAFPLIEFMKNGKLANEDMKGGETELLQFVVNRIDRSMFSGSLPLEWSGEEAPGFPQPKRLETVAGGLIRIDDVFVVIADKIANTPLWLPLTMEQALAPVIAGRRKSFESRREVYEKHKREFAEWLTQEKRAERRANWQRALPALGAKGPDFLANMEKSEIEIEKAKRETLAPGGSDDRGVQEAERDLREAEGVAAAAGASKGMQACYDQSARTLAARYRVVAGAPPTCVPLVRENPSFFDPARSRSAPQILMVSAFDRCLKKESLAVADQVRGGCTVNRQSMESMDWAAVRAWLNQ
jgi:hypothetical protein